MLLILRALPAAKQSSGSSLRQEGMILPFHKEVEVEFFLLGLAWCYRIHSGQTSTKTQKLLKSYTTLKLVLSIFLFSSGPSYLIEAARKSCNAAMQQ